jgi:hypothetical protein
LLKSWDRFRLERHADSASGVLECPTVIDAAEIACFAFTRPAHLGAAMRADVQKAPDLAVAVA